MGKVNGFKLNKKSIIGNPKFKILVNGMLLASASFLGYKVKKLVLSNTYLYDSSYESYSSQIEDKKNIDIDDDIENYLNSMQIMRIAIDCYEKNDETITKTNAFNIIKDKKIELEQDSLIIAKYWCAKKWGGEADKYKITIENSYNPVWIASYPNEESKTKVLVDLNVIRLLDSIGKSQTYNDFSDTDKLVEICKDIIISSGRVTTEMFDSKNKEYS